MSKLAELLGQAGSPISRAPRRLRETPVTLKADRKLELEALLHLRDGFVALDGALVVRPSVTVAAVRGIEDWNQLTLWRTPYRHATEILFFAEDRLGHQFGLYKDEVVRFDPLDGQTEHMGFSLERWAGSLLDDPEVLGRAQVVAWTQEHGPLGSGQRLLPQTPPRFLAAGQPPSAWRSVEELELMQRMARLYTATREHPGVLPEGYEQWWWEQGLEGATATATPAPSPADPEP